MRLFGEVSGDINYRDAAEYLWPPFEIDLRSIEYPYGKTLTVVGPATCTITVPDSSELAITPSAALSTPTSN